MVAITSGEASAQSGPRSGPTRLRLWFIYMADHSGSTIFSAPQGWSSTRATVSASGASSPRA